MNTNALPVTASAGSATASETTDGEPSLSPSRSPSTDTPDLRLDPQSFPHPPRLGSHHFPPTIENVEHLLTGAGFNARFNVIKKRLEVRRTDGSAASMNQVASAAMLNGIGTGWLFAFVDEIGTRNPYNPIAKWIRGKAWDGVDRLLPFYDTVLTVDDYPAGLRDKLLYRWLLGITAAGVKDGRVPIHGVLTFQGEQGAGKTSWIAKLLPADMRGDYIKLDHHLDATNKDSVIGCITHFIVEIGELDSSFRKDVARIKGFLTNDCDKLRRPYARQEEEYPRKTVFAATVNDDRFLIDTTGNRRWWTIAVRGLNFTHQIDMQQLYAQLAVDIERGEQHWLTKQEADELTLYNLRHRSVSAIAERIYDYIDHEMVGFTGGEAKTAIEVLQEIGIANPTNGQCKECGGILRELFGSPKRIQGRDRWRVHVRRIGNPYKKAEPLAEPEF